jgi:soluble lytic murein transglycosylase-like protein
MLWACAGADFAFEITGEMRSCSFTFFLNFLVSCPGPASPQLSHTAMNRMKKFALLLALALGWAVPALAQTDNAYRFDNFDFANGIRIEKPPQPAAAKGSKRTTRSGGGANESANAKANPAPKTFTRLTSMPISRSLDGFSTGDANVDSFILDSGTRHGVDPLLIYAVMHQESTFKSRAVSPKGARGLMQLMPKTAERYGVSNIFDPRQNIEGGAKYLRFLLDLFDGDLELTLAGYNAGEGAVIKYGNNIPPYSETQEYVRRISRRYALIRDPLTARSAGRLTREQLAAIQAKAAAPLTVYERSVYAIRLPDGTLQLISQ